MFHLLSFANRVVTGKDLATVCRLQFPRPARLFLWIMTELAIVGSDIQEVVGSAIAINILSGLPLWAGVLITALDTFTFLILHYFGVRKLEALFAVLIATMAVCFLANVALAKPSGSGILLGMVVPRIGSKTLFQGVGMLGAVIMPHNLFLNSALVLSRRVNTRSTHDVKEANMYFAVESSLALFVSFVINAAVVAVFAVGFHGNPLYEGQDIGLKEAGTVLRTEFGDAALYIWAIGLLAAGQSSTMTGTLAGQFVMSGFVQIQVPQWVRVALTRSLAIVPSMLFALLFAERFDFLDELINVLQSLQLPFALLPLIKFTSSSKIMGPFASHGATRVVVWAIALVVLATNVVLVQDFARSSLPHTPLFYVLIVIFGLAYVFAVSYVIRFNVSTDLTAPASSPLLSPLSVNGDGDAGPRAGSAGRDELGDSITSPMLFNEDELDEGLPPTKLSVIKK